MANRPGYVAISLIFPRLKTRGFRSQRLYRIKKQNTSSHNSHPGLSSISRKMDQKFGEFYYFSYLYFLHFTPTYYFFFGQVTNSLSLGLIQNVIHYVYIENPGEKKFYCITDVFSKKIKKKIKTKKLDGTNLYFNKKDGKTLKFAQKSHPEHNNYTS
ncbi:MAG: hypothetical protein HC880_13335 [Bacteroidia bacterium]|nr:hypothetical protein [Bacteroidia bacterium]